MSRGLSRISQPFRSVLAGFAAAILISLSGMASADWTFVKIDGIDGESTDKIHPESINALSWNWGMTQSGSMHYAGGGGAGKVNVQDFTFTHYVDKASPALMRWCASGKHFPKIEIFVRAPGPVPIEYWKITLEDVLVASVGINGNALPGERPIETVSLNFAKYMVSYTSQKADGSKEGEIRTGFDIRQNLER